MSDDEFSDEQLRKMEAKLLGYEPAKKTTVEVRRSKLKTEKPKKPHIEVEKRRHPFDDDELLYDVFVCSEKIRGKVRDGLYDYELQEALKPYSDEGTEIRRVDANGLRWG